MCAKLYLRDLNFGPFLPHLISTYTCRVTIASKVCDCNFFFFLNVSFAVFFLFLFFLGCLFQCSLNLTFLLFLFSFFSWVLICFFSHQFWLFKEKNVCTLEFFCAMSKKIKIKCLFDHTLFF